MRMVGTVALDAGGSAVTVTTLTGDVAAQVCTEVCAAVYTYVRAVTRAVTRQVDTILWTYRPALLALLAVQRPSLRLVATSARVGTAHPLVPEQSPRGDALVAQGTAGARTRHYERALPGDPTAPRRARELLAEAVTEWGLCDDTHHDAAMVVTELVANAVDHARTASVVTLGFDDGALSIAVRDGNCVEAPRPRPVDPTAPRGRGLQMVEALATSWGVTVHSDGKTVWAVLGCG
jgi:anti-sigma regulatory factor (Ser/Thr protein kinase)